MEFSERKVTCRKIDTANQAYRISTDHDIAALAASIAAVGLIQPPVVVPFSNRYIIVSGHRRVSACMNLGRQVIPVRIPNPPASPHGLARMAVSECSSRRQLNPIEVARAVVLLKPFYATFEALSSGAKELGLPTNPEFLEKAARLATLPETIQELIVRGRIAMPTALELIHMDQASALAIAEVFGALPLSLSNQREVLNMAREIAAIGGISVAEVILDPSVTDLLRNEDLEGPHKSQQLRLRLKQWRFPNLVTTENRFRSLVKQLPLGPCWQLTPPRHFESQTYVFKAGIRNLEELEKAKSSLEELIRSPHMTEIFGLSRKVEKD